MKLQILLSYFYYPKADMEALLERYFGDRENWPDIFADSGAFSAWTLGKPIEIEAYRDWLLKWKHLFFCYANLDVKGDIPTTQHNQRLLETAGLRPMPVFHAGEPFSVLEGLLPKYSFVGLGGFAGESYAIDSRQGMRWLIKCFQMAEGRAVFHGFGMGRWKVLTDLPFYSIDSSSWGQGFRYGSLSLFHPSRQRWYKARLGDSSSIYRLAPLVQQYGFQPENLADRSLNDRAEITAIGAMAWMEAEKYLRSRHGEIPIPEGDRPEVNLDTPGGDSIASGFKFYLGNANRIDQFEDVVRYMDA